MTTFDSTKRSLPSLLDDIVSGKLQLPDFQRGWVWDDQRVKELLVSIARSFPVGAVMLMETGGDVQFEVRPVEGLAPDSLPHAPEKLILDGQQRLTTLTQAIAQTRPVDTQTIKGKKVKRHYYVDIDMALEGAERIEEAVFSVNENRQQLKNFDREVKLDLSSRELECQQMCFPCDRVFQWSEWLQDLNRYNPGGLDTFLKFQAQILQAFNDYQLPIIELKKETSKEAVCLVFEKVNTGGVQLSVFELVTAGFAAAGYNLRDDWYGSDIRKVDSRQRRLAGDPLLKQVKNTEFLQAITLLTTHARKQADIAAGKQGKKIRPVSAKRASVLDLQLRDYQRWADDVEAGYRQAAHFLRGQGLFNPKELPYGTQVVPLAAVLTKLGDRWREPQIHAKLACWYWCGVLGELYGGAVETRVANDLDELLQWVENDTVVPRTVREADFQVERFYSLRSRLSAAYKGINTLILRDGARDFFWQMTVKALDEQDINLDIHHIFPKKWCQDRGMEWKDFDYILNKTPISFKANRKIGGRAPSEYLRLLQTDKQVQLDDVGMDAILQSHEIPVEALRADDFDRFIKEREQLFKALIDRAMAIPVPQSVTETA